VDRPTAPRRGAPRIAECFYANQKRSAGLFSERPSGARMCNRRLASSGMPMCVEPSTISFLEKMLPASIRDAGWDARATMWDGRPRPSWKGRHRGRPSLEMAKARKAPSLIRRRSLPLRLVQGPRNRSLIIRQRANLSSYRAYGRCEQRYLFSASRRAKIRPGGTP
jgi:hypothetical protein